MLTRLILLLASKFAPLLAAQSSLEVSQTNMLLNWAMIGLLGIVGFLLGIVGWFLRDGFRRIVRELETLETTMVETNSQLVKVATSVEERSGQQQQINTMNQNIVTILQDIATMRGLLPSRSSGESK